MAPGPLARSEPVTPRLLELLVCPARYVVDEPICVRGLKVSAP
jgi:hypothetical protein